MVLYHDGHRRWSCHDGHRPIADDNYIIRHRDENRRFFAKIPMVRWHRENHRNHDDDGASGHRETIDDADL